MTRPLLSMESIGKQFMLGGMLVNQTTLQALSDVSIDLVPGRALALVGESGSGKSTCARMLARVYAPSAGRIIYDGVDVATLNGIALERYRAQVQMVFQDPFGSLNPTQTIGYHIERPLRLHRPELKGAALRETMESVLVEVGLQPARDFLRRRPHELSGGQRQRVAIARALSVKPRVLLADEPTSMLDVSVRLGILNLLEELKVGQNLATLYITHDIATARYFAEDTAVLYAGHVVERGPSHVITDTPAHPYAQLLREAVPNPARRITPRAQRRVLDIPMWTPDSKGCPFAPRCPRATDICGQTMPEPTTLEPGHVVRCHNL